MINRKAMTMILAQWISVLGSQLHLLALPLLIYNQTGSTKLLAMGFLFETLPWIVVAPHLAHRLILISEKKILLIADGARGLLCVTLALIPFHPAGFLFVTFLLGTFNAIYGTHRLKLLKAVTDKEEVARVLSVSSSGMELIQIVAPALGSAILSFGWTPKFLMLIDASSFFISVLLLSIIREKHMHILSKDNPNSSNENRASYESLWKSIALREITISESLRSAAEAIFIPLFVVLLKERHEVSPSFLGWVQTTISIGAFIVALGYAKIRTGKEQISIIALLALATTKALFLIPSHPFFVLVLALVTGAAMSLRQLNAEFTLINKIEGENSTVLISLYNSAISFAYIIGYVLNASIDSTVSSTALACGLCFIGVGYQLFLRGKKYERDQTVSAA